MRYDYQPEFQAALYTPELAEDLKNNRCVIFKI